MSSTIHVMIVVPLLFSIPLQQCQCFTFSDYNPSFPTIRCVSAAQALLTSVVGAVIASSCVDVMRDVHWLTNAYVYFGLPYFLYDTWAMFSYHTRVHEELFQGLPLRDKMLKFIVRNKLMVCHHILLPSIIAPIILVLRNNRGDFFFGVFFMMELVIPFISAREILIQLKMKDTRLYFFTSVGMIIMFFFCRLVLFPYLYYAYAIYAELPLLVVPYHIPTKCNFSCIIILIPQTYWFALMIRGVVRLVRKHSKIESSLNDKKNRSF